ncbi:hypothetical protein KHQ82_05050 [Mycoplasmatota bacterium]|nr:hypothetical protein KHQ82_05050 [Mycoplasmatota bacterium]
MTSSVNLVLATDKKEGFFKSVPCYLVFTNDEVVFAFLSKERQKTENEEVRRRLKEEGKGFFKGTAALMSFWNTYGDRYYDISKEDILKEDGRNFSTTHDKIERFVFRGMRSNVDESQTESSGKIVILMNGEKIKLKHKYRDHNKKIKGILKGLYSNRLKYSGQQGLTLTLGKNKDKIT